MLISEGTALAVTKGLDTLLYLCVCRDQGWRKNYGAKGMHAFIDYHSLVPRSPSAWLHVSAGDG